TSERRSTPAASVSDGMVVAIYYTLTDDRGAELDSTRGGKPLAYLHGAGGIVPGLEKALAGHVVGARLKLSIAPEDGYGAHDPKGLHKVPRSSFPPDARVEPGRVFTMSGGGRGARQVRVHALEGEQVVVDLNHPLAGKTLHFDVTIAGIRPATEEEAQH